MTDPELEVLSKGMIDVKVQTTRWTKVSQDDFPIRVRELRVGRDIVGLPGDDLLCADRPYRCLIRTCDMRRKYVTHHQGASINVGKEVGNA